MKTGFPGKGYRKSEGFADSSIRVTLDIVPCSVTAENQTVAGTLGWVYAVAGRRSDALNILAKFNELSSHSYVYFYWVSAIYAGLGEKERALESLEKGYEKHSPTMIYLKVDAFWDALRSDPRFRDLLRGMNLPS